MVAFSRFYYIWLKKLFWGKFCITPLFPFLMNISATFKTSTSTRDWSWVKIVRILWGMELRQIGWIWKIAKKIQRANGRYAYHLEDTSDNLVGTLNLVDEDLYMKFFRNSKRAANWISRITFVVFHFSTNESLILKSSRSLIND